jgi:hypothetical protein
MTGKEILPMLPGGRLAPAGHTITAEEFRDKLQDLGRGDPEVGHSIEDDLTRAVLEQIRDGHPDPVGLATSALVVMDADYSRWFS